MSERSTKPIGGKAYGSIPHLPTSRLGPGDHHVHPGQARICLERLRDRHDWVVVQEKLDGSCVAAARVGDVILALTRAGYLARTSPYEQHHLWADWVDAQATALRHVLGDGERVVGEWLAQAHATRYRLPHAPFVAFDLMRGAIRAPYVEFCARVAGVFVPPRLLHAADRPFGLAQAQAAIAWSGHGALDPVEGAVWRVERAGRVDFLAKWVRADKIDGRYLPEVSGTAAVWNWHPEQETR